MSLGACNLRLVTKFVLESKDEIEAVANVRLWILVLASEFIFSCGCGK